MTASVLSTEQYDAMRESAERAARFLKSMANEHRLMALCVLAEGEISVGRLGQQVPLSQSALSQHLARLREEGLVETRRDGQTIYYRLASGPAAAVIKVLHDAFCNVGGQGQGACAPESAPVAAQ